MARDPPRVQPIIKLEPGRERHRPNGAASRAVVPPPEARQPVSVTETTQDADDRGARSMAPSISTRPPAASAPEESAAEDEEDGDVCFLEVRPIKPKTEERPEPSISAQNAQASFMSNQALQSLGQKLKDINDCLGELQALGIQHVASLPELVLVGDQSSGKSSLMSAIAGLSLPRSSDTCTRCPTHIRISRADEWSCRVFLKQDYEFRARNHPITVRDVKDSDPFPPWVKLPPSQQARHEFKTVRDKFDSDEIELVLRCAQLAILNPGQPYRAFIPKLKGECPKAARKQHMERLKEKEGNFEAQFSPNTVALEVRGPDLADLNFYDLPGVIVSARRREEDFLVSVVRNLTREYISRQNAIILWAVPMNADAMNSYALKVIQEMKAERRCVGAMTKADLLPKEAQAHGSWLSMLKGQTHQLGWGYFITSRPEVRHHDAMEHDNEGGHHDLEGQNAQEEAFFNRTANPSAGDWPHVFEPFKERCGVERLKAFLSSKLGEEFSKVLPEVKQKVADRLQGIEEELENYPEPPQNPEMEIMRSIAEFNMKVKDRVMNQDFMSQWDDKVVKPFRKTIMDLKPKYIVKVENARVDPPGIINLDSPTPTPRKRPGPFDNHNNPVTPSKRQRGPVPLSNGNGIKVEDSGHSFSVPTTPRHHHNSGPRSKTLLEIRHMIQRKAMPGQPGLVFAGVHEPLSLEAIRLWDSHLTTYVRLTFNFLRSEITRILDHSFVHLKNRSVYSLSTQHMTQFLEDQQQQLHAQLSRMYSLETQRLYTQDERSLERNRDSEKRVLLRHRHHYLWAAHTNDSSLATVGPIRKMEDLTAEELEQESVRMAKEAAKMKPDEFEQELSVCAYVRGYYLTAADRFIDYVAMNVVSGLFPRVATNIDTYLNEKLSLNTGVREAILERLMTEGPEISKRRGELKSEKENLVQAMSHIDKLEQSILHENIINRHHPDAMDIDDGHGVDGVDGQTNGMNGVSGARNIRHSSSTPTIAGGGQGEFGSHYGEA
ncbi:P-loop containing nucleoside triphosphate hydrolase protein [Diplogelasinospora grovesii]|uniref:P-loop containing nucleoside triphosphate hydrolase protein n=1 Tax=Diplogelasinospora grovesii TaxID=303347 RepID=A0AAN6N796_9PEZI|nr:P-loop containing nucleoside triphosphate hydrolase protein [Diplogelasinospora grovesii]